MTKAVTTLLRQILFILSITLIPAYFLSIFLTVNSYAIALENSPPESLFYKLFYFPIYIGPIPLLIPIYPIYAIRLSELMLFLLTIYTICLTSVLLREIDVVSIFKSSEDPFRNAFVTTTVATNGSMVIILAIQYLQERVGIKTGEIKIENEVIKYVSIAMAPLIEELGFRVMTIGVFTVIFTLLILYKYDYYGRDNIRTLDWVKFLLFPNLAREKLKRMFKKDLLKTPFIVLIVLTAVTFGSTHYLYGGGWEVGKVSTATIAGLLLGYLYVKIGVDSSIISHYTFNHLLITFYYVSKIYKIINIIDVIMLIHGAIAVTYGAIIIVGGIRDEVSVNGSTRVPKV